MAEDLANKTLNKEHADPNDISKGALGQPNSIISQVNIKVNPIASQKQILQQIQKEASKTQSKFLNGNQRNARNKEFLSYVRE